jgi:Protein of unknown function (DUF3276)
VDNERNSKRFESVYSKKVRAGKRRTYFFDVRRTKGEDFYLTLTESTKRFDGGYERHKIFLYKEDFNRFVEGLEEAVNYIKTELMPQYDYDEFARRQEEYEARLAEENGGERNDSIVIKNTDSVQSERKVVDTDEDEDDEDEDFNTVLKEKAEEIKRPVSPPLKSPKLDDEDEDMSW